MHIGQRCTLGSAFVRIMFDLLASIAPDLVIQLDRGDDQRGDPRRSQHHHLQPRHQGCGVAAPIGLSLIHI